MRSSPGRWPRCVLVGDRRSAWRALAARALIAPLLLYWQVNAPVDDFVSAASDPAVHASYYAPLLGELRALGVGYGRHARRGSRSVPTRDHWEARWVAPHVMLARGWERQLDRDRNALFYEYHAAHRGALPRVAADGGDLLRRAARRAAGLLRARPRRGCCARPWPAPAVPARNLALGALAPVRGARRARRWRSPPGADELGSDSFTLAPPRPGTYTVRVRFTPYWALASGRGCVRSAPGGWTEVQAQRARAACASRSTSRSRAIFDHGPRCSAERIV